MNCDKEKAITSCSHLIDYILSWGALPRECLRRIHGESFIEALDPRAGRRTQGRTIHLPTSAHRITVMEVEGEEAMVAEETEAAGVAAVAAEEMVVVAVEAEVEAEMAVVAELYKSSKHVFMFRNERTFTFHRGVVGQDSSLH